MALLLAIQIMLCNYYTLHNNACVASRAEDPTVMIAKIHL